MTKAQVKEAAHLYHEDGLSLERVGRRLGVPWKVVRRYFVANDVRVRSAHELRRNGTNGVKKKAADTVRLCFCGEPALPGGDSCLACRIHPPCRCGPKMIPDSMYLGKRQCRRCERLEV
jgi:hypothetical protein